MVLVKGENDKRLAIIGFLSIPKISYKQQKTHIVPVYLNSISDRINQISLVLFRLAEPAWLGTK